MLKVSRHILAATMRTHRLAAFNAAKVKYRLLAFLLIIAQSNGFFDRSFSRA